MNNTPLCIGTEQIKVSGCVIPGLFSILMY